MFVTSHDSQLMVFADEIGCSIPILSWAVTLGKHRYKRFIVTFTENLDYMAPGHGTTRQTTARLDPLPYHIERIKSG